MSRAQRKKARIKVGDAQVALWLRQSDGSFTWAMGDHIAADLRMWDDLASPVDGENGLLGDGDVEAVVVVLRHGDTPEAMAKAARLRDQIRDLLEASP